MGWLGLPKGCPLLPVQWQGSGQAGPKGARGCDSLMSLTAARRTED